MENVLLLYEQTPSPMVWILLLLAIFLLPLFYFLFLKFVYLLYSFDRYYCINQVGKNKKQKINTNINF